ncbi:MAG TPA: hypothetical protein DEA50_10125 [Parvularcula sp.]|nr:hypothetical protein [Parvularcula sp.]
MGYFARARGFSMRAPAIFLVVMMVFAACRAAAAADAGAGAYADGDFAAARALGRAAMTAEGAARACEAGLVIGSFFERGETRVKSLHAALDDCARAIEAGDGDVAPYLSYAVGLAFEAKRLRSRAAALRARRFFAETLSRFPDSGLAHAGLAGWHSNVSREAGLVRVALGASRAEAARGFSAALRLDPDNIAINYEYLRFLAGGAAADRRQAAAVAAKIAAAAAPDDALGRLLIERAAIIARALGGSRYEIEAALTATEPFEGVAREAPALAYMPPFRSGFPSASQSQGALP